MIQIHRERKKSGVALVAKGDAIRRSERDGERQVGQVPMRIRAQHDVVPFTPERTKSAASKRPAFADDQGRTEAIAIAATPVRTMAM